MTLNIVFQPDIGIQPHRGSETRTFVKGCAFKRVKSSKRGTDWKRVTSLKKGALYSLTTYLDIFCLIYFALGFNLTPRSYNARNWGDRFTEN